MAATETLGRSPADGEHRSRRTDYDGAVGNDAFMSTSWSTRVDDGAVLGGRLHFPRASETGVSEQRMVTSGPDEGIRFGRTTVVAVTGELLEQQVEGVVLAANRRGVLGASAVRTLGGAEVERQAMARAPLELGTAVVTDAPGLEPRGIRAVVHAVVHPALGQPARLEDVRRATAAALEAAQRHKIRSLAFPLLGGHDGCDPTPIVTAIVDEIVGCLRRGVARLDRIVLVARFSDHTALVTAAVDQARQRSWLPAR